MIRSRKVLIKSILGYINENIHQSSHGGFKIKIEMLERRKSTFAPLTPFVSTAVQLN